MAVAPLHLLMTSQAIDRDHPVLGFSHTWAAKLAERVDLLYLVALQLGAHDLPPNVRVFSLGKERGRGRLGKVLAFQRIVAPLAFRRKIDSIFVQQTEINAILAAPYAKLMRLPLVIFKGHSRSLRPSLRIANALIDRALTSTSAGYPIETPKKIVTGQGIDVDVFQPPPEDWMPSAPKRIIAVGRLASIKRYEVQVDAVNILVNRRGRRDLSLHIYGGADPPAYADQLKALVRGHGLEQVVHLEGAAEFGRMPRIYRDCYTLLHTCDTESLDKAVLEAMSSGKPAITSIQSYRSVMGPLADRLVVPPGDAVTLADRLEAMLDLPLGQHRSIGTALREIVVRDHSVDGFATQVVSVIEELRRGRGLRQRVAA